MVAETLLEYPIPILGSDGRFYHAKACGRERPDRTWEGWFEFESADGLLLWRTGRETSQPNRTDAAYWATGISEIFLEGALSRAMEPPPRVAVTTMAPPAFDGPADGVDVGPEDVILDPFATYSRGEGFLRSRLDALEAWHLRTIARAYRMIGSLAAADHLAKAELIELIVGHARAFASGASSAR
jgi:hypothetical protein